MGLLFYQGYAIVMVMETNPQTDTTPSIEKRQERRRIEVRAKNYSLEAANEPDASRRLQLMHGFLDDVEYDVEAGYIRQGNGKGEPYDIDTINNQLVEFVTQMNLAPQDPDRMEKPQLLIPSAEGFRDSVMEMMSHEATSTPLLAAIIERQRALEAKGEDLKDDVTEKMGGSALSAVSVEEEIARFDQLPTSVQTEVLLYRRLLSNHRESVKDKDYSRAARDREAADAEKKLLSPQAKQFLKLN
jgi:hypothetical protein